MARLLAVAALALVLAAPAGALVQAPQPGLPVHTWPTLTAELHALAALHPDLVALRSLGASGLGLDLWALTVTAPGGQDKQDILLEGNIHGNEQDGLEVLAVVLHDLLDDPSAPWAARTLATRNLTFVLMVNPDGNSLNQRKNLDDVDLNRNFAYGWGGPGSSGNRGAGNYRGTAPESEPETKALAALARSGPWDLWLSMHTGTRLLLWPWGTTYAPPPDAAMFQRLGVGWTAVVGPSFPPKQASGLYLASGITSDYGYSLGFPALTFEVSNAQGQLTYWPDDLALQVQGVEWLLDHVEQMGAHLAFGPIERTGDSVRVQLDNDGWGAATVQLTARQGGSIVDEAELVVPAEGSAIAELQVVPGPVSLLADYAELDQPGSERHVLEAGV